jgi:hypothetical protein
MNCTVHTWLGTSPTTDDDQWLEHVPVSAWSQQQPLAGPPMEEHPSREELQDVGRHESVTPHAPPVSVELHPRIRLRSSEIVGRRHVRPAWDRDAQ